MQLGDLASLVVEQLKVADGASPYALLYTDRFGSRALVAKLARIDGERLFECAYVDLEEGPAREALQNDLQPSWEFVAFSERDKAVYFALAFLSKESVLPGDGHVMYTMRVEDVDELFERKSCDFLVPEKFKDGFSGFNKRQCVGQRAILDEHLLCVALGSLMPVSVVSARACK